MTFRDVHGEALETGLTPTERGNVGTSTGRFKHQWPLGSSGGAIRRRVALEDATTTCIMFG